MPDIGEGGDSVSLRTAWTTLLAAGTRLVAALAVVLASGTAPLAQELRVAELGHFTENRGSNAAGLTPGFRIFVTATVVPSGSPTLVFAEQNGVRQALWHIAIPSAPNSYAYWRLFEPKLTGSWQVVVERGEAKGKPVSTPVLAKPQEVPLVRNVRVTGSGPQPTVRWVLPDLTGFDIDRIRVAVRGGERVMGRFLDTLHVSGDLPPTATTFRIPAAVLASGERYVFQVMLEDLEGGALENRSSTFSEPYYVSR
jgi:hypothetical protein